MTAQFPRFLFFVGLMAPLCAPAAMAVTQCHLPKGTLKNGAPYKVIRPRILAAGYFPTPPLLQEEDNYCQGDNRFARYHYDNCKAFPEMEICSADGYCNLNFRDKAGNRLEITIWGTSITVPDDEIDGWDLVCAHPSKKEK